MVEDCLVGSYGVDGYIAEGMIYLLKTMVLQALVYFEFIETRSPEMRHIIGARGHESILAVEGGKVNIQYSTRYQGILYVDRVTCLKHVTRL